MDNERRGAMTIGQKVTVTLFGMGPYPAEVIGFGQVNGDTRIAVKTRFGVCKVFAKEVRV